MSRRTKKLFEGDTNARSPFYGGKVASLPCIARVMMAFKLFEAKLPSDNAFLQKLHHVSG